MSLIDYPYSSPISQIPRGAIIILRTESAAVCEACPRGAACPGTDPHPPVRGQQALGHHALEGGDLRGWVG